MNKNVWYSIISNIVFVDYYISLVKYVLWNAKIKHFSLSLYFVLPTLFIAFLWLRNLYKCNETKKEKKKKPGTEQNEK